LETHLILIVFLYLVFSIVALNAECKCIIKEKRIKIITMCRIMYILTLGIIPALLCCIQIAAPKAGGIIDYSENAVWTFYVQVILTVIGYLAMNFGYAIKQRTPKTHTVLGNNKVLLTSFICVCFGTVAFYLFASAFGGVDRLMEQAEWIRAGVVLPTKNIAFFKHFVPLAFLSSYLTFNLLIRKQVCGVKKLITYILFAASVVVSVVASVVAVSVFVSVVAAGAVVSALPPHPHKDATRVVASTSAKIRFFIGYLLKIL